MVLFIVVYFCQQKKSRFASSLWRQTGNYVPPAVTIKKYALCLHSVSVCWFSQQDRQYTYNVTLRRVRESLLPWKAVSITYLSVCAWVRAFVRVLGRMGVCMRVRPCILAYSACNTYAPYCDVICGHFASTIFFDIISQMARFSKKSYWP